MASVKRFVIIFVLVLLIAVNGSCAVNGSWCPPDGVLTKQFLERNFDNTARKGIDLRSCQIHTVEGRSFTGYNNLKVLHLDENSLNSITNETFAGLFQLEEMYLSKCDITLIQDNAFLELKKLKILELEYNSITTISESTFAGLQNIDIIRMGDNPFQSISDGAFEHCPKLYDLRIDSKEANPKITNNTFHGLKNLQLLYLSSAFIPNEAFRESANTLHNLKLYKFSTVDHNLYNAYWQLKQSFAGIKPENFILLGLINNGIQDIYGASFSGLRALRHLYIQNNNIPVINKNAFTVVPTLETLDLQNNNIVFIDNYAFASLPSLTYFHLEYNRLTAVSNGTFKGLFYLEELNLQHNALDFIKENTFADLHRLKCLYLHGNRLSNIAREHFRGDGLRCLQSLTLMNNRIKEIEDKALSDLSELLYLNLTGNIIVKIMYGSFSNLKKLKNLDLSQNKISFLEDNVFRDLGNLQELKLDGNELKTVTDSTFFGLSASIISIKKNNIQTLTESDLKFILGNKFVNFDQNPIHCNCEMKWLRELYNSNSSIDTFQKLRCYSPQKFQRLFVNVNANDFVCEEPSEPKVKLQESYTGYVFTCQSSGNPTPSITITIPGKKEIKYHDNKSLGTNSGYLDIGKEEFYCGVYECVASNVAGNFSVNITIDKQKYSKCEEYHDDSTITKSPIHHNSSDFYIGLAVGMGIGLLLVATIAIVAIIVACRQRSSEKKGKKEFRTELIDSYVVPSSVSQLQHRLPYPEGSPSLRSRRNNGHFYENHPHIKGTPAIYENDGNMLVDEANRYIEVDNELQVPIYEDIDDDDKGMLRC